MKSKLYDNAWEPPVRDSIKKNTTPATNGRAKPCMCALISGRLAASKSAMTPKPIHMANA